MAFIAPYFGYLASFLLIVALLVSTDLKFRWFNTGGNVAFIIYAIILQAYPVLITNCILICINIIWLVKVYRRKENFDLIPFSGNEIMATKFLDFYHEDIDAYFPDFEPGMFKDQLNFVVLRDMVIANMFSANISNDGDAEVALNYTLTKYRDYKVGRFIFDREKQFLISSGIKRIVYKQVHNRHHLHFLKRMGFSKAATAQGECYIKDLQ